MFYIIGSREKRKAWEGEHRVPHFECEEHADADAVRLHNHEDERATMFVNLSAEPIYTVQVAGEFGIESEVDYDSYDDAIAAYEKAAAER